MKTTWQPTASFDNLKLRSCILKKIRDFFYERDILEVDTPLLCSGTVTDPYLTSMTSEFTAEGAAAGKTFYLQTSPEFAMKRLLAAGSGSIYQICKAFRNGEAGRFHNPEFTMLEWYRPGFDHHDLMAEMNELLQAVLACRPAVTLSYQQVFEQSLNLDPHTARIEDLQNCAQTVGVDIASVHNSEDRDLWLQLLMSYVIEPQLGQGQPTFIYDFPASQAALARVTNTHPPVAQRFEVYINGIELANGFYELADATEQERRFNADLQKRLTLNLPQVPLGHYLLAALAAGFPDCAGVALGIDRLVMIATKANSIADVISLPISRA